MLYDTRYMLRTKAKKRYSYSPLEGFSPAAEDKESWIDDTIRTYSAEPGEPKTKHTRLKTVEFEGFLSRNEISSEDILQAIRIYMPKWVIHKRHEKEAMETFILFSATAHREFLERSFRDAIDVALLCEHDIVRAAYWRYNRKPTQRLDENTFVYQDGPEEEWRVLRYDPASEQCNIFDYKPGASLTFADLERQVEKQEQELEGYRRSEADYSVEIRAQRLLGHGAFGQHVRMAIHVLGQKCLQPRLLGG